MTRTRTRSRTEKDAADAAPRLHVVTFGCQMNKYDSERVEGRFRRRGWRTTSSAEDADAILFNTCSVREHAEDRVWSWLGRLKREKERRPDLVVGVMGCMAQRVGEELFRRAGHVDVVCGTRQLLHLPELVEEVRARRAESAGGGRGRARVLSLDTDGRVSADREGEVYEGGPHGYLAVMRGCDLACSFCVVPSTRGRVQSRPIAEVVREARWMVERGARAISLLGQTIDAYGRDLSLPGPGEARGRGRGGRPGLADLVYRLQELEGLVRIRLVTLHPTFADEALARALRDCDKCDRFLPLPLQSGSDRVLAAMRRGYDTELYRRRIDLLREQVPDLELASDWIVGFPGEGEEDFRASERLLLDYGFAVNYVFQYSPRPGTTAAALSDDVPEEVKKERHQRLLAAAERAGLERHQRQIGRRQPVFVEEASERAPGTLLGRTFHNLACTFEGPPERVGVVVEVTPLEASSFGLAGRTGLD